MLDYFYLFPQREDSLLYKESHNIFLVIEVYCTERAVAVVSLFLFWKRNNLSFIKILPRRKRRSLSDVFI